MNVKCYLHPGTFCRLFFNCTLYINRFYETDAMQCNALNIKTAAKQVWLYFIRRTTRPGYASTTMNLQIVLNNQKNPYLNQATQKTTC